MKPSALPLLACLTFLLAFSGCGGKGATRPASSLSPQDHAVLDQYEQIRAALAADDLSAAKQAGGLLVKTLTPADATTPASPALTQATSFVAAVALDRARQVFKKLSAAVIPMAQGVDGFYVMTCPLPSCGDWVQQKPDVDNPYLGKSMHTYGDLKK